MVRTSATNTAVILRRSRAFARDRLEGWKRRLCLRPSFETLARKSALAPQDDGFLLREGAQT